MRSLTISVGLLAALVVASPGEAQQRYSKQKVVYHISYEGGDESKAYMRALTNIQNHVEAVGKDRLKAVVVMHGDGLNLLKEARSSDKLQSKITSLKSQKVNFEVCNNTLVNRKIDYQNELFDVAKADIVPSGVAELSHLQHQGYTYIRP